VIPRPTIAHLTTGREIVPPESRPSEGQVRNSNATLIHALARHVVAQAHSGEDLGGSLGACSAGGFGKADLVIVSGGASVGDHDHTGELLESLGFGIVCRKVAVRPGKPFIMGLRGDRLAVGLPGNPVSHFATFYLFVQRILDRMSGRTVAQSATARLRDPRGILEPGKLETWWPAVWRLRETTVEVEPKPWLHSGHLSALADANALLRIPAGPVPADGTSVFFLPCGQPLILPP
jgi:molybdopterin molybdotransferase